MEKTIENMDRNRLGILIRCLVILLITGVTNSAAVFVSPLAAHFNWTADAIANVSTTMLLCWTPGALIGGTLMSKIGARNAMLLGAVLFPLGTLTSSFVPQSSPWLLYVTFSFLQGLGNGLAYTVATYVSTGWYPDKRGLVSGLCMAFTGGSSAFLAPICSKLVQSTGIISTLRIVGLVSLVVCVVCALGVRCVSRRDTRTQLRSRPSRRCGALRTAVCPAAGAQDHVNDRKENLDGKDDREYGSQPPWNPDPLPGDFAHHRRDQLCSRICFPAGSTL